MKMFAEKTLEILRRYVDECHEGVVSRASTALGMKPGTLDQWVNGRRDPSLSKIGPIMDKILWGHSEPQNVGVLEVKFPEIQASGNDTACRDVKKRLEEALERITTLEKELIAMRASRDELRRTVDKMVERPEPVEVRQIKSSG